MSPVANVTRHTTAKWYYYCTSILDCVIIVHCKWSNCASFPVFIDEVYISINHAAFLCYKNDIRKLNIQSWSKRYRSAHNKLGRTAQLQTCFNMDSGEMGALNKLNLFNCTMLPLSFLTVPSIPVSVSQMLS